MKICPNPKCSRFGRIVYSLVTRCQVCKWDLRCQRAKLQRRGPRIRKHRAENGLAIAVAAKACHRSD